MLRLGLVELGLEGPFLCQCSSLAGLQAWIAHQFSRCLRLTSCSKGTTALHHGLCTHPALESES